MKMKTDSRLFFFLAMDLEPLKEKSPVRSGGG